MGVVVMSSTVRNNCRRSAAIVDMYQAVAWTLLPDAQNTARDPLHTNPICVDAESVANGGSSADAVVPPLVLAIVDKR